MFTVSVTVLVEILQASSMSSSLAGGAANVLYIAGCTEKNYKMAPLPRGTVNQGKLFVIICWLAIFWSE
jgi:hypothetical protein